MLPKLPIIENAVYRISTHSKQFNMSLQSWGRVTVQLLVKYQIYFKIALMTSTTTYSFGYNQGTGVIVGVGEVSEQNVCHNRHRPV